MPNGWQEWAKNQSELVVIYRGMFMVRFGKYQKYTSAYLKKLGKIGTIYQYIVGYTLIGGYNQSRWFKKILKTQGIIPNIALDAGCGRGEYSFWLAEAYPTIKKIDAYDISEDSIAACRKVQDKTGKFKNINFKKYDLTKIDEQEKYDLIFCIDVLEHLPNTFDVLCRFSKVLKPQGYCYIRIPTERQDRIFPQKYFGEYEKWAQEEHIGQHYDMGSLKKDLNEAGFEIVFSTYTNGFFAKLGFELGIIFEKKSKYLYALSVPFLKMLYFPDSMRFSRKSGNGLIFLAQKKNEPEP